MPAPWEQEEIQKSKTYKKILLSLILRKSGSCSLETKQDRRKVPRAKSFVPYRRLQEQRSQPRQTALGVIPNADSSVAQKTNVTLKQHQDQRTNVVCFSDKITGTKATTPKNPS
jgi:hypothetical protein